MLPLVSHDEYADGTYRQTDGPPDHYYPLSAMDTTIIVTHAVFSHWLIMLAILEILYLLTARDYG